MRFCMKYSHNGRISVLKVLKINPTGNIPLERPRLRILDQGVG